MTYKLYAEMRDGRNIFMCDMHEDFRPLVAITNQFDESDNIARFYITKSLYNKEYECYHKDLASKSIKQGRVK